MFSLSRIKNQWLRCFISAGYMWWKRNHANEAAALAFYSLFSLIPILLIGLFIAAMIVGQDSAATNLLEQTNNVTGFKTGSYLKQALSQNLKWTSTSYSPFIGGIALAFSATKVISELRRALTKIFERDAPIKRSNVAISTLTSRLISLIIIISLGLLIAGSVIGESILNMLKEHLHEWRHLLELINYLSTLATFFIMTIFSIILMRWLPVRPPPLREAVIGGTLCSLLIVGLKYGLTIFLTYSKTSEMFAGAVTLVLLLLWIYLAMQVILYSAEFTAQLVKERQQKIN